MGCVSSVFQFGSYLVQEGAEVTEEQKEESTSEKDGVPVPSSPSQDTVVTTASSGGDKVQESPTKPEAPLAKEEEFTQETSPVAEEAKEEEPKQGGEDKTGEAEAPEPEVKELQRVNETKLEKEKTVDTSGVTTEKTVYTQISESVTIQESKGPAVDPFASSQTSPSYVHSVKVTESSSPSPGSPVSVNSDVSAPEKTETVRQLSESVSEKVSSAPEKVEVPVKSEVVEVATDVAESLSDSHREAEKPEVPSPPLPSEEPDTHVVQETPGNEAEIEYDEEIIDDIERADVEGAVVKIQAGIRGYLTRKAIKESRKDGPLMQSETGGASVQATSKQDEVPAEETPISASSEQADIDSPGKELDEKDAAVKIQAMYRGYRTRKQLDEMLNEPCDEEVETLNTSAEKKPESPVQESRRSPPDRSPVTVTENFVPILKAQITITPPSSPTLKQHHNLPSVEAEPKDSKTSAIPETSDNTDETSHPDLPGEDEENKKHAATKIQAAFRGYKVRKVSRKEPSGNVKAGSEEAKENTDLNVESNVPEDVNHESSPPLLRDTPSPPLDPDNEEDTLEDSTADDVEEIPNIEWQTSELYADEPSSKHLPEPDGSKTETVTEEATAPVVDSPKTVPKSSEQVILSTAKITLESHGSPPPTTEEDQQMQSDH